MTRTIKMTTLVSITHRLRDAYVSKLPTRVQTPQGECFGYVKELTVFSETGGYNEIEVKIEDPKRPKSIDRCRCVPIPVLDQPDRRYVQLNTRSSFLYHISEMKDLSLPSLRRKPRLIPPSFGEEWDRYELGPLTVEGDIEFTVEMTGRNASPPKVGAQAEAHLDSVIWTGYIQSYNLIYCCERATQIRITLRPTGGPVFPNQQPVTKESTMKVFETIIVTVDAQNVITGIAQPVKLVTALDAQTAKDQVLVDYAVEHKLSGKDLAGFKVRTREFCG